MLETTREKFDEYSAKIGELNGVKDTSKQFAVKPNIQQAVVKRIRLTSDFLSRIGLQTVTNQEGEKLGVGAHRPIASRTSTNAGGRRVPTDPTSVGRLNRYRCEKQNSDYAWKYDKLDAWADVDGFQQLLRDSVLEQQGLDMIMIGWNGTHVADDTDLEAFPLLQDVNKGWIQHLREDAPERVMSAGLKHPVVKDGGGHITDPGKILIRADGTGDYVNLDALVTDGKNLLDERHRTATDLVVIIGSKLASGRTFKVVTAAADDPVKKLALDVLLGAETVGGLPAVQVPYFPEDAIMITSLKNLSIYIQKATLRRMLKEEPEFDQVANYESQNVAFVIEVYGKVAFFEHIDSDEMGIIEPIFEVEQEPGLA